MLPADVLAAMLRSDPARPRITCYDDSDPSTGGERVELSAKVLANWVAKAGNLLQDEWDVTSGSVVYLDLPAHWRTAYWALATWSVGAAVALGDLSEEDAVGVGVADRVGELGPADALLTTRPQLTGSGGPVGVVTLAALARRATPPVPAGVLDEAAELATFPDVFDPWAVPSSSEVAMRVGSQAMTYAALLDEVSSPADGRGPRIHLVAPEVATFLVTSLRTWAADGSVVLSTRPLNNQARARREAAEGATPA